MSDKCPPEESFEIVTPGQAVDEVRALSLAVDSFVLDVQRGARANPPIADKFANLIYPAGWQDFEAAWDLWLLGWRQYSEAHNGWFENFDSATVSRVVAERKCDLNDFAAKLRRLGVEPVTPGQKFSTTADTTSNLTTFAGIALAAGLIYLVATSRGGSK